MSGLSFFDMEDGKVNAPSDPIWSLDLDDEGNEKEIHRWLKGEIDYLRKESDERIKRQRRNIAIYKGIQYESQDLKDDRRDTGTSRSNVIKKIVANHVFDLTEQRVSKLIKYRPAVQVLPTNDEFEDKISAKITKNLLDHIWYNERFEGDLSYKIATYAMIFGECTVFPLWDESKGDLSPAYKKAKEKADKSGSKIPMIDENGNQKKDQLGNLLWVNKKVRVGDVDYYVPLPSDVFFQKKPKWGDVEYLFVCEVKSVEELRTKHPDKAKDIVSEQSDVIYDWENMQERPARNEVLVWTFWHKRTEFLETGRKIVFTDKCILSNEEFPFSHEWLPCVRFTDWDIPGEIHGYSYIETIKGLTGTYNNLTNLILRNQIMASHPKWMVPAGSCKLDQLGNDITIVQYKGPQSPVLVQSNPTPNEIFQFRAALKEEFQQIAGVFGVSRGEPPPGIKAGVALQFLSEQESERFNKSVLKWNEFIRFLAQMTIAVCGDKYDTSDERMIRVIGKDNKWMSIFFDVLHLEKSYNIVVQNSSALPQSKAARTQTLMDLNQQFPGQVPPEQVLDMLDMAQSDKFIDSATMAVKSAEAENEKLLEDAKVDMEPAEYEDHAAHWKVHVKQIQDFAFKYMTPTEAQERLKDHILVHEMFIVDQIRKNPTFKQMLLQDPTFKQFPIFFVPDELAEMPIDTAVEPPQGAAPGQAYTATEGEPINPEAQGAEPMNTPPPNIENQLAMEEAIPGEPEPIAPTGAV